MFCISIVVINSGSDWLVLVRIVSYSLGYWFGRVLKVPVWYGGWWVVSISFVTL